MVVCLYVVTCPWCHPAFSVATLLPSSCKQGEDSCQLPFKWQEQQSKKTRQWNITPCLRCFRVAFSWPIIIIDEYRNIWILGEGELCIIFENKCNIRKCYLKYILVTISDTNIASFSFLFLAFWNGGRGGRLTQPDPPVFLTLAPQVVIFII